MERLLGNQAQTDGGPCSAESEQQVFETAKGLKAAGVEVLRAGIWKPRTRPNCFEGVGSEGLVCMKRVQRELGMKISTEVANVKHVYEALKAGVDMLWIGALRLSIIGVYVNRLLLRPVFQIRGSQMSKTPLIFR